MRATLDVHRTIDHALMTPAGKRFWAKAERASAQRFKMRWKKKRFVGKISAFSNWQYRKLELLYLTAHVRDDARLDQLAAERNALMDRLFLESAT